MNTLYAERAPYEPAEIGIVLFVVKNMRRQPDTGEWACFVSDAWIAQRTRASAHTVKRWIAKHCAERGDAAVIGRSWPGRTWGRDHRSGREGWRPHKCARYTLLRTDRQRRDAQAAEQEHGRFERAKAAKRSRSRRQPRRRARADDDASIAKLAKQASGAASPNWLSEHSQIGQAEHSQIGQRSEVVPEGDKREGGSARSAPVPPDTLAGEAHQTNAANAAPSPGRSRDRSAAAAVLARFDELWHGGDDQAPAAATNDPRFVRAEQLVAHHGLAKAIAAAEAFCGREQPGLVYRFHAFNVFAKNFPEWSKHAETRAARAEAERVARETRERESREDEERQARDRERDDQDNAAAHRQMAALSEPERAERRRRACAEHARYLARMPAAEIERTIDQTIRKQLVDEISEERRRADAVPMTSPAQHEHPAATALEPAAIGPVKPKPREVIPPRGEADAARRDSREPAALTTFRMIAAQLQPTNAPVPGLRIVGGREDRARDAS